MSGWAPRLPRGEGLCYLLWPDSDPDRARHALSQTRYELKKELGDGWVETAADRLRSLNAHPHYHLVVLDGVFSRTADGDIHFHEASELGAADVRALEPVLQRRVLRWFRRSGLLD